MRQTLAAYFAAHFATQCPTQADADRHATALEAVIVALPAGYTAADRIRAIEGYLVAQVAQAPADAQRHATAINAALPAVPVQQTQPPRNQTQPPRNQPTPPAAQPASHGWAIAALIAALVAAVLAGIAAFRDTGASAIEAKVAVAAADTKATLAEVKGAVKDPSGLSVLDAVKGHQVWSEQNSALKSDLGALAKEATLVGIGTKVDHIDRVVTGSMTYTPKSGRNKGQETIISLRGLAHQADLAALAKKSDLAETWARAGTVVVTTDGAAEVLTGSDATAALADPAPASP